MKVPVTPSHPNDEAVVAQLRAASPTLRLRREQRAALYAACKARRGRRPVAWRYGLVLAATAALVLLTALSLRLAPSSEPSRATAVASDPTNPAEVPSLLDAPEEGSVRDEVLPEAEAIDARLAAARSRLRKTSLPRFTLSLSEAPEADNLAERLSRLRNEINNPS